MRYDCVKIGSPLEHMVNVVLSLDR
jgi:hypothetical protein